MFANLWAASAVTLWGVDMLVFTSGAGGREAAEGRVDRNRLSPDAFPFRPNDAANARKLPRPATKRPEPISRPKVVTGPKRPPLARA